MSDVVIAQKTHPELIDQLLRDLRPALGQDDTIYAGYPILRRTGGPEFVDLLIASGTLGVVALDLEPESTLLERITERLDDLYADLQTMLYGHKALRQGRDLAFKIQVVAVVSTPDHESLRARSGESALNAAKVTDLSGLLRTIQAVANPVEPRLLREISAVLQRVTGLAAPSRRVVSKPGSLAAKLALIEGEIANLDKWQKRAAIETPEGPQRIRGLAGSGKTIVLALKAADLLARHPDWRIAFTFYTRSLYQQLRMLVTKFSLLTTGEDPDFERLHLRHAWGSSKDPGFYSSLANLYGQPARDFLYARSELGGSFEKVCAELLVHVRSNTNIEPLYDAVLIDEAQDFPQPFFELAFFAARPPKRVVWAYDELQNLGDYTMLPAPELFGSNSGKPRVQSLENRENEAQQDVILPVCYRNTPWALTSAHAVGFGIYSSTGLVQFFDQPDLWDAIGYEVASGRISPGEQVVLRRRTDATPHFFRELLNQADAISWRTFASAEEQAGWVSESISKNLSDDELHPRDILIVLPDAARATRYASPVMAALSAAGIRCHVAGVTSSRDELFVDGSIALSSIYRAKGNEAPVVYVLHSEYAVEGGYEAIRRRNALFTAMTRSKGWLRITGVGEGMKELQKELDTVRSKDFELSFRVPTPEQLEKLRRIHRNMSVAERVRAKQTQESLERALRDIQEGRLSIENLPKDLVDQMRKMFGLNK